LRLRDVITRCNDEYAVMGIGFPMYMLITSATEDSWLYKYDKSDPSGTRLVYTPALVRPSRKKRNPMLFKSLFAPAFAYRFISMIPGGITVGALGLMSTTWMAYCTTGVSMVVLFIVVTVIVCCDNPKSGVSVNLLTFVFCAEYVMALGAWKFCVTIIDWSSAAVSGVYVGLVDSL